MGCATDPAAVASGADGACVDIGQFSAIFIGPPGVGKGTQCEELKKLAQFEHISTGNLVRSEIQRETPIGLQIKEITARGELTPDAVISEMLSNHLKSLSPNASYILDGFPRTSAQAVYLKDQGIKITHIIELQGDEAAIT